MNHEYEPRKFTGHLPDQFRAGNKHKGRKCIYGEKEIPYHEVHRRPPFAPARFFAAMEGKEHSLKIPALIAVTGALVSALAAYATMSGLYAGMFAASGAGAGMGMFMGLVGAVSAFIAFIVLWWVIMAGAFYVVSILFKGSGTFSSTLAVTGYGLVPTIIGTALSAISSLLGVTQIAREKN